MAKLMSRMRLRTAATINVPAAANSSLQIGDPVLLYRDAPVSEWIGPFRVIDIDGKAVSLVDDGKMKRFSIDRCKRYHEPAPRGDDESGFSESRLDKAIIDNSLYAVPPI